MGSLADNLLKITDFPFSYSLIGLLALIFGEGLNLEEASLAKIGPLLILMGFVGTTLSICDPIGVLQKVLLRGFSSGRVSVNLKDKINIEGKKQPEDIEQAKRQYEEAKRQYRQELIRQNILNRSIFGKSGYSIPWTVMVCLCRNFEAILKKNDIQMVIESEQDRDFALYHRTYGLFKSFNIKFKAGVLTILSQLVLPWNV